MAAHIKVWEQIIADGNPPAIILESDAKKVRSLPTDLPNDGITILGGNLRTKATSDVSTDKEVFKYLSTFALTDKQVYGLGTQTWINSLAYYVPPGKCGELLSRAYLGPRKLRSPDNWLSQERFVDYLVWPNPYVEMGVGTNIHRSSQADVRKDSQSDLYCCLGARGASPIGMPAIECSTLTAKEWIVKLREHFVTVSQEAAVSTEDEADAADAIQRQPHLLC